MELELSPRCQNELTEKHWWFEINYYKKSRAKCFANLQPVHKDKGEKETCPKTPL